MNDDFIMTDEQLVIYNKYLEHFNEADNDLDGEPCSPEEYFRFYERERRTPQEILNELLKQVYHFIEVGEDQKAADEILLCGEKLKILNKALDVFCQMCKDEGLIYRTIIDHYTSHGYNYPKKIMMKAKRIAPNIPDSERYHDLPRTKEVTVYRATASRLEQAKNEISWTINKDVAIWFAYKSNDIHSSIFSGLHVYQGIINYDKIIAYTNDRNECEVMQYRNVRNIIEIFPTKEEIERAIKS